MNVPEMVQAVTKLLGKEWSLVPDPKDTPDDSEWDRKARAMSARMRGPEGIEVYFHHDSYRKRLTIGPSFPRDSRNGNETYEPYRYENGHRIQVESIGVAPTRSPEAITAEIKRRLLPSYVPAWKEALNRKAKSEAANENAVKFAQHLAKILGEPLRGDSDTSRELRIYHQPASFEVSRHGSLKVEINTDNEALILAVAKLVADLPSSE